MRVDVLSIFPEMFAPVLGSSILKRAIAKGVLSVSVHDLRRWSRDKHKKVDDRPYGGGPGMVMKPEPFFDAVDDLKRQADAVPHVVLLSPQGDRLTQKKVEQFSREAWLLLLCGHYEGVDERVRIGLADEEVSIGDYVLTCGELPAMVLIDSVARLLPGALGDPRSVQEESFQGALLEYPQYTRPEEYRGFRVPEVLLSGDHTGVERWRALEAMRRTHKKRPDLMQRKQHGPSNSSH